MSIYNMLLVGGSYVAPTPNYYSANRRRTLMLLGDSITWGFGVLQYQTYAKAMQAKIDTVVAGGSNTDEWTARNVQADDIFSNIDSVTLKLQNAVGISYDNIGPFQSTYVTDGFRTNPAILMDAPGDEFSVTPSSFDPLQSGARYLTVMVKVTGTGTNSATIVSPGKTPIGTTLAKLGGSNIGVNNIYRLIYDAGAPTTSFTISRVAATPPETDGDAVARILSVNPTNIYPSSGVGNFGTTGYINVQINARGSYVFSDYSNDMAAIHESVIFPTTDTATLIAVPVYVIALGTVSMYFSQSAYPGTGDRRITPTEYATELNALIDAILAVSPTSPIALTYPPTPNTSQWFIRPGFTRGEYDAVIASIAATRQFPTVDLRTTLNVTTDYLSDGLHPNVTGQGNLATAYINALGL